MTTTDPTALAPCEEVARLLESFEQLGKMDVAFAIEQAGGASECVSPDYPTDGADQAVDLAAPVLTAEVNAALAFLVEHGPPVALAFHTIRRLDRQLCQVIEDTFGDDDHGDLRDGLRITRRLNAAHALADQVFYAHRDNYNPDSEPMPGTLPG